MAAFYRALILSELLPRITWGLGQDTWRSGNEESRHGSGRLQSMLEWLQCCRPHSAKLGKLSPLAARGRIAQGSGKPGRAVSLGDLVLRWGRS